MAVLEDVEENLFAYFIQYLYISAHSEPTVSNSSMYGNGVPVEPVRNLKDLEHEADFV